MSTFCFFCNENNSFFNFQLLKLKITFRLFGFRYFLVVFERTSFYFRFVHSDVGIKQYVSFRYRNELKISPQKRIGFMHVDITIQYTVKQTSGYC
jgi:hypothetical protein